MDLGILLGSMDTWVLLIWAVLKSGDIDVASLVLVGGATGTVSFLAYPARNVKSLFKVIKKALSHREISVEKLTEDLVGYAEVARHDGILSLENNTKDIEDPFIVGGIQMAVNGMDPQLIKQIMTTELDNLIERHEFGKLLFDGIGKYAPAFGIIGTLVGLVVVLQNMDDPSKSGLAWRTLFCPRCTERSALTPLPCRLPTGRRGVQPRRCSSR